MNECSTCKEEWSGIDNWCPGCGKRLSPEGSSPASCSRTRAAGRKHDAHDKPTAPLGHSRTEEGGEWISVSNPPASGTWALVVEVDGCLTVMSRDGHEWIDRAGDAYDDFEVSKWCPIPEPPDESEAEGVQDCPDCDTPLIHYHRDVHYCTKCSGYWSEGDLKRRKRSGSGNDQAHPPAP